MTKLSIAAVLSILTISNVSSAQTDAPPASNAPIDGFTGPKISLGARAGVLTAAGTATRGTSYGTLTDDYVGTGTSVQGELGVHFAAPCMVFGAWEYGSISQPTSRRELDRITTQAVAAGLRFTTNRRSRVGFVAEYGLGYRFVSVSEREGTTVARGIEPVRAGIGITVLAKPGLRLNLMTSIAASLIDRIDPIDGAASTSGPDEWQVYRTLTLGGTFDL